MHAFCGEPHSGIPPPLVKSSILYHGSIDYPLPAGFPRNRSPLKGNPPFRGKPSALGHEGVRGRRLHGAAMLCRLQCARFAIRWRIAGALPSSPRHSPGRRRLSRGGKPPVKVWLGGSTPNEITSGHATSRSEFSLNRLQKSVHRTQTRSIKAPVIPCVSVSLAMSSRVGLTSGGGVY